MSRALVGLLALLASAAMAQVEDAGVPASAAVPLTDTEALRRDFDARLEAARREVKDLREEMRAQLATNSAAQGWQEDWVDEKRKLELVTFNGYLRARPELFYKFNFWGSDSGGVPFHDNAGYTLWPTSAISNAERTNAGINMRFRLEPTLNISEEVRVRAQIDMLDNLIWGTTPDYAYSLNGGNGYAYDRTQFGLFSTTQTPPRSGINSITDSVAVKRVWGEVATPIGILRFGRMASQWGLGMLYNDGNGIDSDYGDTVDRVSFTAEPLPGFYITPMLDMNVEGLSSVRQQFGGQPFDLSNSDEVHSFLLAIARRDTETERLAKLDSNQLVFNYGLHFSYKVQRNEAVDGVLKNDPLPYTYAGLSPTASSTLWVQRKGSLFIPDLWAKLEMKNWRVEVEGAAILGQIENRALTGANASNPLQNQALYVYQFGAVLQAEYRFLNGDLEIGIDMGFASGDKAPGFGLYPRRIQGGAGAIDGPQYNCTASTGVCQDNEVKNFAFNPDYRVDMILYREILGGITDSIYFKPRARYRITQGLEAYAGAIYSRAIFSESTPGAAFGNTDPSLGIELNAGVRYETEDGFFGQLQYGILFPLSGMGYQISNLGIAVQLDNPQALRAVVGIKF